MCVDNTVMDDIYLVQQTGHDQNLIRSEYNDVKHITITFLF